MSGAIQVTWYDGWAVLRISREDKRNAVDRATRAALIQAFDALEQGGARAVVLTGSGSSFCAGMDLKEKKADRESGSDTSSEEWIAVNLAIRRHPAIFIAAVNGLALGGGATLINVCDLAIASTDASIGCPEMGFATYPAMAGPSTQLTISRKRAAWMVLTTNRIDGYTAERWGLVNEVVQPEQLLSRASEIATQIVRFDPVALAEAKKALDQVPSGVVDWRAAMDYGQAVNASIRARTNAADAGLARFSAGQKNRGQGV